MICRPSKAPFDAEWFHQLLREAHGVSPEVPQDSYSELHHAGKEMAKIMKTRLSQTGGTT